jgi:hypothetical protein
VKPQTWIEAKDVKYKSEVIMDSLKENAVPPQQKGQQADIVESIDVSDSMKAGSLFAEAKKKLFDISGWGNISKGMSAEFALTDPSGVTKHGLPGVGDHIRINIPGPGSSAGDGYDWVKIELVQEESKSDKEFAIIRVRPSADPGKQAGTAHFFDSGATSSFVVQREGCVISAEIHGRNEEPNTESEKLSDKVRNLVVGTAATIGLARIQWQKLAKGLLSAL